MWENIATGYVDLELDDTEKLPQELEAKILEVIEKVDMKNFCTSRGSLYLDG